MKRLLGGLTRPSVVAVLIVVAVLGPGGWVPAGALACAQHADPLPQAVLDGTAGLSTTDKAAVEVGTEVGDDGVLLAGADSDPREEPPVERTGSPVVRYTFFGLAFGGLAFIAGLGIAQRRRRRRHDEW